jgi:hypothetical protein
MSTAYRKRKKAIRDAKRHYHNLRNVIPEKDFRMLQAQWRREVDGPPIGTLEDLLNARAET